jgi:hypothetical protein
MLVSRVPWQRMCAGIGSLAAATGVDPESAPGCCFLLGKEPVVKGSVSVIRNTKHRQQQHAGNLPVSSHCSTVRLQKRSRAAQVHD